jgi:hypothetical protein
VDTPSARHAYRLAQPDAGARTAGCSLAPCLAAQGGFPEPADSVQANATVGDWKPGRHGRRRSRGGRGGARLSEARSRLALTCRGSRPSRSSPRRSRCRGPELDGTRRSGPGHRCRPDATGPRSRPGCDDDHRQGRRSVSHGSHRRSDPGGSACGLATGELLREDFEPNPVSVEGGRIAVPDGPGNVGGAFDVSLWDCDRAGVLWLDAAPRDQIVANR